MRNLPIVKDKEFYKSVISIMLPVALQQAINMGVNMMDTIMLGSFGETQMSASSLANSFYSIFQLLCMGVIGGCSVLVSQYWGAQDKERARETFSLAMRIVCLLGIAFALVTWFFPEEVMQIYTSECDVVLAGVDYLKITAFIYLVHGTGLVAAQLMRSVKQAQLGMYVSIVSFVVNISANWIFIFGHFGMPRMEIAGAALGTLIARCVEFLITFIYILKVDKRLGLRVKHLLKSPSADLVKRYLRVGMPALISDGLLGIGNNVINMIIGGLGKVVVAANSTCTVVERLFTVMITGVSNAAGVIVGNTIGAGKKEEALLQGKTFYLLGVAIGLISGTLVFFVGPLTLNFYVLEEETVIVARQMMHAYALTSLFQCIQSIMTKGVLRGGGDTRFLMIADIVFLWAVSLPLGYFLGLIVGAPAWVVILALKVDVLIKSVWCIGRLLSAKWIRKVIQ